MKNTRDKTGKLPAVFEQMEPRLLFSAGTEGALAADALPGPGVSNPALVQELVSETGPVNEIQAPSEIRQELVFVDLSAPDYQQLADDLLANNNGNRQIKVFYLDSNQDGIEQISAVLDQQQGIDAIHIISHGNEEGLKLGNTWLTNTSLNEYRQSIQGWRNALNNDADLLLYGCNLAGGEDGVALINSLANLTGADIAASDDLTGNARHGGDWEFEYNTGEIETAIAFSSDLQKSWSGTLSITKAGGQTLVNTTTTDDHKNPVVASADDGSYVVVWQSNNQNGDVEGIFGQRFNANGGKLGSEFPVNTTITGNQAKPAIAMDDSGNFVVVWQENGNEIFGQRFDSNGVKLGSEFQVNTYTTAAQREPDVAMDDSGNFVVVWENNGQDGNSYGIFGQRYDSNGVKAGIEFQVNQAFQNDQLDAAVAMDSSGNFVVTWSSWQDGATFDIYGQLYNSSGAIVKAEFLVNTGAGDDQTKSDVAMNDSDFVVVWESSNQDGNLHGVYGKLYNATGGVVKAEFLVNSTTENVPMDPAVSMDSGGNFIVVWKSFTQGSAKQDVYGQLFDNTGTAVGGVLNINTETKHNQQDAAVAMNSNGDLIVAWESRNKDGSLHGIYSQRYTEDNVTPVVTLPGGAVNYTENDPATIIDAAAIIMDANFADFNIGTLTVDYTANATLNDLLGINDEGPGTNTIEVYGSSVSYNGIVIGTFTGGAGLTPLVVTLNINSSVAAVQALTRNITYRNTSEEPFELSRTVRFVLTDGDGGSSTAVTETINVTSVNDVPVITIGNVTGNITEGTTLTDNGSISFTDFDMSNRPTAGEVTKSVSNSVAGGLNATQLAAIESAFSITEPGTNTNNGTVNWNYTITEGELDFLAAGETVTAIFTITVTDDNGATDTQDVTITITGTNDTPTIGDVADIGFTEAADASAQDLSASGTVSFDDIDTTDLVDIGTALSSGAVWSGGSIDATLKTLLEAGFTASVTDAAAPGSTAWDYMVNNADLDFLKASETITLSYTLTATDSAGATASDTVTITITGTNDTPTIGDVADIGFTEAADASAQDLSASGTVSFDDIDTTDLVDIGTALSSGAVWSGGSIDATLKTLLEAGFTASVTDAAAPGSTAWDYMVNNADLDFLKASETITLSYTLTATDSAGATASDTVTITITGTNDTPSVSDVAITATEDGATVDGSFVVNDTDTTDTHTFNITSSSSEGSVVNNGDGTFTFDPGPDFQDLLLGQTRDVTFTYTTTDENGASSTAATVTVAVTGTADLSSVPESEPTPGPKTESSPDLGQNKDKSDIDELIYKDIEIVPTQDTVNSFILNKVYKSPVPVDTVLSTTDDDYSIYSALRQNITIEKHDISSLELWQMIDFMKEKVNNNREEGGYMDLLARSASGMALSLSAGVITWALQGGSILASMLSSVPLWKGFDPLPIITKFKKSESDDETTQTSDALKDEQNAARLLDTMSTGAGENNGHD